jgi:drug/metabolite transporter (DMT)-like permease
MNTGMRHSKKGNIFLLTAALVWGFALVAQKAGMFYLGPFAFTAIRCTMGGVLMLPLIARMNRKRQSKPEYEKPAGFSRRNTILGSLICGTVLAGLILFQQFGLPYTTVGKAGFITALYILITPIMGIFLGKKISGNLWIGVAVGIVGMYFLCLYNGLGSLTFGDGMMLCAAVVCAVHLHVIDHFVETVEPVKLSAYQFIVAGLVCVIPAVIFETTTMNAVIECAVPILYAALFSCGIGYTFQVLGQKETDPSLASLILSLETVFSLGAGWLVFGEVLTFNEYIGCMLMFAAIIISQLHPRKV